LRLAGMPKEPCISAKRALYHEKETYGLSTCAAAWVCQEKSVEVQRALR